MRKWNYILRVTETAVTFWLLFLRFKGHIYIWNVKKFLRLFFRCAVHSQYCHFVIRSCLQFFPQFFFFFFFFACAPTMHSDCNKNNWISISYTTFFFISIFPFFSSPLSSHNLLRLYCICAAFNQPIQMYTTEQRQWLSENLLWLVSRIWKIQIGHENVGEKASSK